MGAEKVLAMLKGSGGGGGRGTWDTTSFGVVLTQQLEVLAILRGGGGGQTILSREYEKVYLVLKGGTQNLTLIFKIL